METRCFSTPVVVMLQTWQAAANHFHHVCHTTPTCRNVTMLSRPLICANTCLFDTILQHNSHSLCQRAGCAHMASDGVCKSASMQQCQPCGSTHIGSKHQCTCALVTLQAELSGAQHHGRLNLTSLIQLGTLGDANTLPRQTTLYHCQRNKRGRLAALLACWLAGSLGGFSVCFPLYERHPPMTLHPSLT